MCKIRIDIICIAWCVILGLSSCKPPRPVTAEDVSAYQRLLQLRAGEMTSSAFLIDLRINNAGKKFSVTTEVYFSGDSVGFYGRGYLGKGAFRGNIIDDYVTVVFSGANEYFEAPLANIQYGADCARPGEVLLYVLSLVSGRDVPDHLDQATRLSKRQLTFPDGRFTRTVTLEGKRKNLPKREKLIDSACRDSIVISYYSHSESFPYFNIEDILYYNGQNDFRARGFIREQRYNVAIPEARFKARIPAGATLIESF